MDRGLLARATSADDGPTPGYLYGEIAKMTRASFDVCAKVEEYLAKRCSNKNANVKLKALVVIRHVAEKGAPQFKQQMVRRLPVIKDCQQFSGPPDPLRGDEPYRKVRVAAKDAIEALTSDDYEQPAQSMQGFSGGGDAYNDGPANYPPQRGRMEGFGNSIPEAEPTTYMAKAQRMASQMAEKAASRLQKSDSGYRGGDQRRSAEFSSHRSMPGVGNPRFGDARNAPPSWKERVQEGARQAADSVQKMRFGTSSTESFDPSYNYASNRGANAYGGGTFQAPSSSSSQDWGDRRRGNVGGGWGNTNTPQPPPRQSAPSYEAHTTTQSSAAGRAGGAATDGEYERHLVKDLCGAGGTRAAPPADKLQAFVDAAATLDADAVGPALLEELDDAKPWQSRAKACAVVEALCRADGCEHHLGYFSEVADDLQGLEAASNLALRKQARRMLSALGVAGDAPAAAPRRAPPPASTEADLLGGFAEPAAAAPSLLDEFGGEPAAAAPASAPPSLLDEFGGGAPAPPAAPPAPPPAPPAPAGLFGNLSVKETPPPPPPKTEEEPPSLLDAFSAGLADASTAVSDAFPATAAAAADVFGSGELAPAAPAAPPPPPQETPKSPVSPGGDPFAALTGLPLTREDKYHAATAGRTGPAFVAPQSQQQQWQAQQQYQQQQAWQQQQWQQQQWLRQQQMAGGPPSFTAAPPMMPGRAAAIPPAAAGESPSGFAFMGAPAQEADSFGFVSDMIGAKK